MSGRLTAVNSAQRVLEQTEYVDWSDLQEPATAIGRLRATVRTLLEVLEAQPRSERLAAQRDEEFRNLAHAARLQIRAARGELSRLAAFERALADMLDHGEPAGGDES